MATQTIKFNAFNVRNTKTGTKASVHYSLDNRADQRKCVTVYGRDYGHDLQAVFAGIAGKYENDTDSMTDYFETGRIRIFETDAIYEAARAAVVEILRKEAAKREARHAARAARVVRAPHYCTNCDQECANGRDCCSDEFPEAGQIRETGK